ncbi:hypothetical protein ACFL2G_03240 [Candidatus Omnitrophota bacterium]
MISRKVLFYVIFFLILFFQSHDSAEAGMGNKVIGSTIKSVVRVYTAITNIEKAKKKAVVKITEMNEETYRTKYTKLYRLTKELPADVKAKYKITPYMSKQQMIENLESVDKKTVYETLNRIPNETLAELFKQYLKEMGQKPQKSTHAIY